MTTKNQKNDCSKKVEKLLKELSKCISINKETKVYTLQYSTLPNLDNDRYIQLRDSLLNVSITYYPGSYNSIKHFLYCNKLQDLLLDTCKISLSDVRKYFGIESKYGINKIAAHSLYYFFNNSSYPDCYDNDANIVRELKCTSLSFVFDENQVLIKVNTEFLGF